MRAQQWMMARRWEARVRFFAVSVFLVIPAMNVGAQTPVAGRNVVSARPATVDTRISMSEALESNRATFVAALGAGQIREITTVAELQATRHEVLVARLRDPAIRQITEGGQLQYVLPYRFEVPMPGTSDPLRLRAVAVVEQGGLRVDPNTVSYRGSVRVGIENEDNPGAPPMNLTNPVLFQLVFNAGPVNPTDLEINHTNLPFKRVQLDATGVPDRAVLSIRASFDPNGEDLEIPLIPLDILSAPAAIPGLGFGFGDVNIQLPGFLVGKITEVTLSTSRGYLRPTHVTLSEKGHGQSVLRSAFFGAGEARINIERADLSFAPVSVRLFWPWALIIALLAGAAVSGALFARTKTKGGFLLGSMIGFVVGVAICAGINLTGLRAPQVVTVAVAFVFAASPGFGVARKIWKAE